jgi:hypothetical protein
MSRFEDRLWMDLVEQHGALLAAAPARTFTPTLEPALPRRLPRLVPAASIGLALAAVLTVLVIALTPGGGGNAAYAVSSNPNGTISVTIEELVGVTGASRQLASLGVPVRVVTAEASCPSLPDKYRVARLSPGLSHQVASVSGHSGAASVLVTPSAIPAGDTVLIGASELERSSGPAAVALEVQVYEGETPPCLPLTLGG